MFENVVLPGTAFVELALAAGREVGCEALEELTLQAPLLLAPEGAVQVQVTVGEADGGGGAVSWGLLAAWEDTVR